jgi:hypothetical protein
MGSCSKGGTKAGIGVGGPRAELGKAHRQCRQHKGVGEQWRSSPVEAGEVGARGGGEARPWRDGAMPGRAGSSTSSIGALAQ